ncbi:unnamed protein product [Fraxinus pennsylvanica]|uniref:Uncharacterized protein n=1 Tax=Fraxinus pennsylvanica TaxID=56036 RepID=A0AAD1Z2C0_9LAMI|nr:unnamed protein product [Fraxinus pennsylvanica]
MSQQRRQEITGKRAAQEATEAEKNKASQATTASDDASDTAAENSNGIVNDSFKKDSDAQKALEQVEMEYVPEKAELDDDLNEEFRKVFEKFSFSEGAAEENDKKDETSPDTASKKKADSDSEEEEQDTQQKEKGVSNKQKKWQCQGTGVRKGNFCRLICLEVRNQTQLMSHWHQKSWNLRTVLPAKYEEAREEEKVRSQKEDFSDMVAENVNKKETEGAGNSGQVKEERFHVLGAFGYYANFGDANWRMLASSASHSSLR